MAEQFAYVSGPEYTNKIPSLLFLTVLFDAMFKYTSSLRDFAWFNFNVQQFWIKVWPKREGMIKGEKLLATVILEYL